MSKTTGEEEEAPKDMMGGRRAEIDTKKRGAGVTETASQSESSLIGHRYLEKCKVGLDIAGYLQTERYYTLLIGSTRALPINQTENRQRRRDWDGGGGE